MPFFPCAHAGHPLWSHAVQQVIVQLRAQIQMQHLNGQPCLGLVYISVAYAPKAGDIVAMLSSALPDVQHWVGCAGHSVLSGDMDYGHTGALAVMLPYLGVQDYQVFSGVAPWENMRFPVKFALIHGDASSPHGAQQVQTLHQRLQSPMSMGALCDLSGRHAQWSWAAKSLGPMPRSIGGGGVQVGGLSGVAFAPHVDGLAVGMQGCKPVGRTYRMSRVAHDVVLELDGQPALEVLARDAEGARAWPQLKNSWMAITPPGSYISHRGLATASRVLGVVGIDALRQGIVLNGCLVEGHSLTACQYDEQVARVDMRRACAALWESLTSSEAAPTSPEAQSVAPAGRSICGAIYIRNAKRHTLSPTPQVDAELQLIRHALGPVPLLGFSSSLELDGGALQHGSAQLLVFTQPLQSFYA